MEIIETVPIMEHASWVFIAMIVGLGFGLIALCNADDCRSALCIVLATLMMILIFGSLILLLTNATKHFDHDEYIVRISDDYPANKFNAEYVITKEFEYSDVIQVKKRE